MTKYLLIIFAIIYALSPYDFFPDFFFGWGWIDDLIILGLLWRYLKSIKTTGFDPGGYEQKRREYFEKGREYGSQQSGDRGSNAREKDPYTVLGVERGASPEAIKKAYKQLAGKYHPDKVNHLGDEFKKLAEERFKEIQGAYQELVNRKF